MTKKAMVAFSGGLDTSMLVPYIKEKYGISDVMTCVVDTGGMSEAEKEKVAARAAEVGSTKHIYINAEDDFYNEIIKYLIFGNISRDGYPLCVGSERLLQAREVVKAARAEGAEIIVHGSTGAGNDQYRFDLVAHVLGQADEARGLPALEILAPIRTDNIKREFSQNFLKERQITVSDKTAYSYNAGLWGVSIGGKETHNATGLIPDDAWYSEIDETRKDETIEIEFMQGNPIAAMINNKKIEGTLKVIKALAECGGAFGIGRHYHVGTSIPGKKGRIAYESPAADILYEAHSTLEKITLTQAQIFFKKQVANEVGRLIHEAKFFDPLLDDLRRFLESSQKRVTGKVFLHLKTGRIAAATAQSQYDLLAAAGSVYGEFANFYSPADAVGSSKINAYEQVIYHGVKTK